MRKSTASLLERLGVKLSAFFLQRANKRYMKNMRKYEEDIEENATKLREYERKIGVLTSNIKRLTFYFSKTANKQYRLSHQNKREMCEWVKKKKR